MKTSRFRLLIGLAVVGFFAYVTCVYSIPRLYREYTHADQFAPVLTGRILEAKCTTWNFFMFNSCDVRAVVSSGEEVTFEDWRFGPAPTGPVRLVGAAADPPIYSTDVSIRTLPGRLTFTVVTSLGLLAFGRLGIIGLVRGFRK